MTELGRAIELVEATGYSWKDISYNLVLGSLEDFLEDEGLDELKAMCLAMTKHSLDAAEAFAHVIRYHAWVEFEWRFVGRYESFGDYAEQHFEGVVANLPEILVSEIDWDAVGDKLLKENDCTWDYVGDRVYVFKY